jgi:hypothetical protein
MPTKHTHGLLAQTAFFRPADGLHVTDFAIGVDKELHEDGAFDLVVDSIVRIPKVFVEEMRPGGVASWEGGFDRHSFVFIGPLALLGVFLIFNI